jgi:hypothetical protein
LYKIILNELKIAGEQLKKKKWQLKIKKSVNLL